MVVNLPKEDEYCPIGKNLIVSGWGKDYYRDRWNVKRHLWGVEQQCVNVDKCTRYTGDPNVILCVGDSEEHANSACYGDSGGRNSLVILGLDKMAYPIFFQVTEKYKTNYSIIVNIAKILLQDGNSSCSNADFGGCFSSIQ